MQFHVRALDAGHTIQQLTLDALDEEDARRQLQDRVLTPLSVNPARRSGRGTFSLLLFSQELHALIAAGLNVMEALDTLAEKEAAADTRAILTRLGDELRNGNRLSNALAQQPQFFPPLFVGIVKAAEGTSDLPGALGRFIDYQSRVQVVRHKVLSAAIYPAVLMVVGSAVSMFLLGYVVPRFAAVYKGSGRPLPWASEMLLTWGSFAGQHATSLALGVLGGATAIAWGVRARMRAGGVRALLAWIPAARERWRQFELSRLYLTLGTLIEGGIALPQALTLSAAVLPPNSRPALEAVRRGIEQGDAFSQALEVAGLSTPVANRLLRVGEQSGQLGKMLARAALFYEGETTRWLERFTKTFEPVLMAAIGLVVGVIVILLYMPIFDLAGSLQ